MRFLIMLEQTDSGFAIQVPDLAITTFGKDIEAAKFAARQAIQINLEVYCEIGQPVPDRLPVSRHLENPDFRDLLFAYIDVAAPKDTKAA